MRTIITLRPTKDGKTTVTRKQLFDRFVQRGGKRARDTSTYEEALAEFRSVSAKFSEAQRAYRAKEIGDQEFLEAKRKFDEAGSKVDKAEQQSGSDAKDLFIGNRGLNWEREDRFVDSAYTGDKRRVVVHNYLPVRKAKDAIHNHLPVNKTRDFIFQPGSERFRMAKALENINYGFVQESFKEPSAALTARIKRYHTAIDYLRSKGRGALTSEDASYLNSLIGE